MSAYPQMQVMLSACVCVLAQISLNYSKPHKNRIVFLIAQICFSGITVKYLSALLLTNNDEARENSAMAYVLIAIDLGCSISGMAGMILAFFVLYKKLKQTEISLTSVGPSDVLDKEFEREDMIIRQEVAVINPEDLKTDREQVFFRQLKDLLRIAENLHQEVQEKEKDIDRFKIEVRSLTQQLDRLDDAPPSHSQYHHPKKGKGKKNKTTGERYSSVRAPPPPQVDKDSKAAVKESGSILNMDVPDRFLKFKKLGNSDVLLMSLFRRFADGKTKLIRSEELSMLYAKVVKTVYPRITEQEAVQDAGSVIQSVDADGDGVEAGISGEGELPELLEGQVALVGWEAELLARGALVQAFHVSAPLRIRGLARLFRT